MKKFYYEVTINGQSFTTSTLAEALKKARKKLAEKGIGVKKSDRALQFNIANSTFDNSKLKALTVSDSVEEIPENEYKALKERAVASPWNPTETLTPEQKAPTVKMLTPQMQMCVKLPEIINRDNEKIKKVECRVELRIDPKQRIGVYIKNRELYKIDVTFWLKKNEIYYGLLKPTSDKGYWSENIEELLELIKANVAIKEGYKVENIEISLGESVKTLIQKTVNFQEYLAQRGITQRYVAPNAGLNAIDFSGKQDESVKSLGTYLDNFEPYDKMKTDLIDIGTANRRLAENGIFSQFDKEEIASRTVQTIERMKQIEGCISTRSVQEFFPYGVKGQNTLGNCNAKGGVRLAPRTDKQIADSMKQSKESGFHPTASPFQVFVHEDTHAMLFFVMRIFGEDFIEDQFSTLVKELRRDPKALSIYGATTARGGSKCHEMVAEARTEIICEGKNARPFCRKVYATLMKFYKKALERAKELKIDD